MKVCTKCHIEKHDWLFSNTFKNGECATCNMLNKNVIWQGHQIPSCCLKHTVKIKQRLDYGQYLEDGFDFLIQKIDHQISLYVTADNVFYYFICFKCRKIKHLENIKAFEKAKELEMKAKEIEIGRRKWHRDTLSNDYLKSLLSSQGFRAINIKQYPEIMELKRNQIKIKRLCNKQSQQM